MVLVTEIDATSKKGHKVIRGTPEKLIGQLTEDPESLDTGTGAPSVGPGAIVDPTYVEDFLLTYRTFTRHVLLYLFHQSLTHSLALVPKDTLSSREVPFLEF